MKAPNDLITDELLYFLCNLSAALIQILFHEFIEILGYGLAAHVPHDHLRVGLLFEGLQKAAMLAVVPWKTVLTAVGSE